MTDYRVVGGDLIVTHAGVDTPLSLEIPMTLVDAWLEIPDAGAVREIHSRIRDEAMPPAAREVVLAVESVDGVRAMEMVNRWSRALGERLGKCLSLPGSGENIAQPSQPTSGSVSESEPIASEPTPTPAPRKRTRSR